MIQVLSPLRFHISQPEFQITRFVACLVVASALIQTLSVSAHGAAGGLCADSTNQGRTAQLSSAVISIDLKDVSLESAFQEVSRKAGVVFNYNHNRVDLTRKVSIRKTKTSACEVMQFLLGSSGAELVVLQNGELAIVPSTQGKPMSATIKGTVIDKESGKALPGATVELVDLYRVTKTDTAGNFSLAGLLGNTYTLEISHVGYGSQTIVDLALEAGEVRKLEISLKPGVLLIPGIIVSPGTFGVMEVDASINQSLTRENIQTLAQFGEDVYRTVTRLPGVTSDDYSARFSVRGGRHEDVLVLFDGQELHEPFHVQDVNGGVVSIVDADAIEGVTLMTGGFPAEFGNKTSGVFDITSRKQRDSTRSLSIGCSLTNLRLLSEGTFGDQRGSWFFVARRGYLDLVLDLMKAIESPNPSYYDVFSKVRYQLSPNQSLSFNLLQAQDKMTFLANDPDGDIDQTNTQYGSTYGWLSLQSMFGSRIMARSNVSLSRLSRNRKGSTFNTVNNRLFFSINDRNTFDEIGIKQDWSAQIAEWMNVKWGIEQKFGSTEYFTQTAIVDSTVNGIGSPVLDTANTDYSVDANGRALGTYLSARLRLSSRVAVETGGRYDQATHSGDRDFSPRVSGLLQASKSTFVRAGWGFYRQMQAMQRLDVLDGVSSYYPSELAQHLTVGLEHQLPSGVNIRVEAYHIHSSNPKPSFRNWKNDFYQFHNSVEDDRIAVYSDAFVRKGIELYARKSKGGRITWMGSYVLAFHEETIDSVTAKFFDISHSKESPAPFDQRHAIMLDGTYHINSRWALNVSWSFHTGWPYTGARIDTVGTGSESVYFLRPKRLNSSRLPAYSNVSMRVTRQLLYRGGQLRMHVDVLNLLGQSNVYAVDGDIVGAPAAPQLITENRTWLKWLPSFGISWTKEF